MESLNFGLFIADEKLYAYAASSAKLLPPKDDCDGRSVLLSLRKSAGQIRHVHALLKRRCGNSAQIPAAWEWLLDNAYMARREQLSAAGDFSLARHLRRTEEGVLIVELARSLLLSGEGRVTEERCRSFLDGFQSVTVLRREELQLFPAALRAAVLEEGWFI